MAETMLIMTCESLLEKAGTGKRSSALSQTDSETDPVFLALGVDPIVRLQGADLTFVVSSALTNFDTGSERGS